MTSTLAVGSGRVTDVPSEAEAPGVRGEQHRAVRYSPGRRFEGNSYAVVPIVSKDVGPTAGLMAEGYREQADEALWFAESSLSVQAEALPAEEQ